MSGYNTSYSTVITQVIPQNKTHQSFQIRKGVLAYSMYRYIYLSWVHRGVFRMWSRIRCSVSKDCRHNPLDQAGTSWYGTTLRQGLEPWLVLTRLMLNRLANIRQKCWSHPKDKSPIISTRFISQMKGTDHIFHTLLRLNCAAWERRRIVSSWQMRSAFALKLFTKQQSS